MARIQLAEIMQSALDQKEVQNGLVYFVQDSERLFYDLNDRRTEIRDVIILETEAERSSIIAPKNKFYFIVETATLWLYHNGAWVTTSIDADVAADEVSYSNPDYPTVAAALDKLLYVAPEIKEFKGGSDNEIGSTITTVKFSWAYNKVMKTQSINQGIGEIDINARTYTLSDQAITSRKVFKLTASDGTNSVSKETAVNFYHKRYWGVSSEETLTNAQILALSKEFSTNRKQTRTFNCSGGRYFYLAIPTAYCDGIMFKVGGLSYTDMKVETIEFTNASGYTDSFNLYRSGNIQTGSAISVEVL